VRPIRRNNSARTPVAHHVYDLGSILCGIDVHTERPFAERSIHNLHDCFPDRGDIRVRRNNRGKALHHIICEVFCTVRSHTQRHAEYRQACRSERNGLFLL